jgi:hypothetical protein
VKYRDAQAEKRAAALIAEEEREKGLEDMKLQVSKDLAAVACIVIAF